MRVQHTSGVRPTAASDWKHYLRRSERMRAALLRLPPELYVPRHSHAESEELFFVVSGSCLLAAGDQEAQLIAGDVAIVEVGEPHAITVGDDELVLLAVVAPDREDAVLHE